MKNLPIGFPRSMALGLLVFLTCTTCIDRLDFIGETNEGQLVIYGLLTDGEGPHTLSISRTRSYSLIPVGIDQANAYLITPDGLAISYTNLGEGKYEVMNFIGQPGNIYQLEVEINGEIYRSSLEKMPPSNGKDNISFTFDFEAFENLEREPIMTTYAETELPESSTPLFLRWSVEETHYWDLVWIQELSFFPPRGCFIFDMVDPNRLNLYDGTLSNTRSIQQILSKRKVDNSFLFPYFLSITQLSITPNAFTYWQSIKSVINNRGSLFDIPPATVSGNISNVNNSNERVLGYFEVAKIQITRIYTTTADVPFYIPRPCDFIFGRPADQYLPECHSCTVRARGRRWTNQRPSWWEFN